MLSGNLYLRTDAPRVRKPDPPGYPAVPQTVGGHLRRRRMDLGLSRKEVGRTLGVKAQTVALWELGFHHVSVKYLPAVTRFLGFDPDPEVTSLPERLRAARRRLGISQKEVARRFRMDPKTIRQWEAGRVSRRTRRVEGALCGVRAAG